VGSGQGSWAAMCVGLFSGMSRERARIPRAYQRGLKAERLAAAQPWRTADISHCQLPFERRKLSEYSL
jgi:hypothetical protein